MCISEEVAGGNAADSLVDVHGCDLSWCPANTNATEKWLQEEQKHHPEVSFSLGQPLVCGV